MAFNLSLFNSTFGFRIFKSISTVSTFNPVGDVNNDGYVDIGVGYKFASPLGRYEAGEVDIVLGNRSSDVYLGNATLPDVFRVYGASASNRIGSGANGLGDINNDGIDDYGFQGKSSPYQCVIIYGNQTISNIDLLTFPIQIGFTITTNNGGNNFCSSISGIGDINNDTIDDIGIGDINNSLLGRIAAGAGRVLYGINGKHNATVSLDTLTLSKSFDAYGAANNNNAGKLILPIGDFDNDGVKDFAVSAINASPLSRANAGILYIVKGVAGGIPSNIDFANFTSSQGFPIYGASANDLLGTSFSAIGDVNGDSIDDIAIGSPNASPLGRSSAGVINIVYGKQGGYSSPIDTASLLSSQGYKILGPIQYASLGNTVSSAGDFDDDGRIDVMAAVSSSPVDTTLDAVYFLYSKQGGYNTDVDLASLTSSQGLIVYGAQNEVITKCSLAGNAIGDSHLDYLIMTYSDAYVLDGGKLMQFADLSGSNSTTTSPTGSTSSAPPSSTGIPSSTSSSPTGGTTTSPTGSTSSTPPSSTGIPSSTSSSPSGTPSPTDQVSAGVHDYEMSYIGTALIAFATLIIADGF